jgi:hypothetical protein
MMLAAITVQKHCRRRRLRTQREGRLEQQRRDEQALLSAYYVGKSDDTKYR